MIKGKSPSVIVLCLMVSILFLSCAKSESPSPDEKARDEASPAMQSGQEQDKAGAPQPMVAGERDSREEGSELYAKKTEDGLGAHFLTPMDLAKERMLEYTVNVSYECEDILASRKLLLNLIAKYGFFKRSSATTESREPSADVEIMVSAGKLYEALQDFERLGILKNEDITVLDHTESMVMSRRRVDRENIRIMRRNKAMGQITAQGKNWQQVEGSLEQSEDKLDQAEQEKWQIQDRVAWATVRIHLRGPDMPNRVDVPMYRNAFIGLVNVFLRLVYVLIWILPFIVLAGGLWMIRGRIKSFFTRKKSDQ